MSNFSRSYLLGSRVINFPFFCHQRHFIPHFLSPMYYKQSQNTTPGSPSSNCKIFTCFAFQSVIEELLFWKVIGIFGELLTCNYFKNKTIKNVLFPTIFTGFIHSIHRLNHRVKERKLN